jgi:pilus assembly protein CpaD
MTGLVVGAAAVLAACGPDNSYFPPRTGYVTEPPRTGATLQSLNYRVDLGHGQTALTRAQIDGLNHFLVTNGQTDGDHIEIRTSTLAGPGRNGAIAASLRNSFLAGGYVPSRVEIVEAPGYADTVEVVIQRYTAMLPDCSREIGRKEGIQQWSDDPVDIRQLGCSTETNLGLMVADPRDLAGGRELAPAAGYHEVGAIKRYRTDTVKKPEKTSSKESSQ